MQIYALMMKDDDWNLACTTSFTSATQGGNGTFQGALQRLIVFDLYKVTPQYLSIMHMPR